jgi:hypothetical protein
MAILHYEPFTAHLDYFFTTHAFAQRSDVIVLKKRKQNDRSFL